MRVYKKRHWVHFTHERPVLCAERVRPEQINDTIIMGASDFNEYELNFNGGRIVPYWQRAKIEQGYLSNIEYEPPSRTEYQTWYYNQKRCGCIVCGEQSSCCLTYHHLIPPHKGGDITRLISSRMPIEMILTEMSKCILLCRNCHAKVHHNQLSVSHIQSIDYMQLLDTDPATQGLACCTKREPFVCKQCNVSFLSLRKRLYCTPECGKAYTKEQYKRRQNLESL